MRMPTHQARAVQMLVLTGCRGAQRHGLAGTDVTGDHSERQ